MKVVVYKPVHHNHDHRIYANAVVDALRLFKENLIVSANYKHLLREVLTGEKSVVIYAVPNKLNVFLLPLLCVNTQMQIVLMHDQKPHAGLMWLPTSIYNIIVRVFAWSIVFNKVIPFFSNKNLGQMSLGGLVDDDSLGGKIKSERAKRAIFFGRWKKYRGVDRLPEIIQLFNDYAVDFMVLSKGASKLIESDYPNLVVVDKRYEQNELNELLSKTMFAVFPYYTATQSGAIVEALSYGVKCLVQDLPELRSQLDGVNGVVFVDFSNALSLNDGISRLLSDETDVDISQIENLFSYKSLVRKFYTVFIDCL